MGERSRRWGGTALALAICALVGTAPVSAKQQPVVNFAFTGDIAMVAGPVQDYFASIEPIRGDVVLGNLEGTLTDRGSSKCPAGDPNCFAFHAPPSYAGYVRRAGFTVVNLANNHALDYGTVGQADTVAAVRKAGLLTTGRPDEIAYMKIRGTRVAVLGFAPYPWAQSLTDIAAAQALVRRADKWADLVVVTMHAGAEGADHQHVRPGTEYFLGENRGNALAFAHAVISAGADLVVGSGPHVLRGMEWYHGRLIDYSMGNFVGYHTLGTDGVTGVSGILHVTLTRSARFAGGDLVPITIAGTGIPRVDPSGAADSIVRDLSREDFGVRAMRVAASGTLSPP